MPKRRRNEENEEESIETGNVDQGDFSDGDSASEDGDDGSEKMDKYDLMNEDDIEGQEDPTQAFEGDVQITPFNMKEEMEEGHFDKAGTYIFGKRDKDEVKDHWLDNIDWIKVNNETADKEKDDMDIAENLQPFDSIASYKEILTIINPGETVLKAIKRLGGKKIQTASERWKKKKETGEASCVNEENKAKISQLTELAASILSNTGNMDIYQETFEGIRFKIQQSVKPSVSEANTDMFGEMFVEKQEPSTSEGEPSSKRVRFDAEEKNEDKGENHADITFWEFKWENQEEAEVHGPHSSNEMQSWVTDGYFEKGVWVRRIGQQGDFYSSKRVDFELYI